MFLHCVLIYSDDDEGSFNYRLTIFTKYIANHSKKAMPESSVHLDFIIGKFERQYASFLFAETPLSSLSLLKCALDQSSFTQSLFQRELRGEYYCYKHRPGTAILVK